VPHRTTKAFVGNFHAYTEFREGLKNFHSNLPRNHPPIDRVNDPNKLKNELLVHFNKCIIKQIRFEPVVDEPLST